jgi:photosystem II stability/assembly factor-like uncharacterized protein
VRGALLAGSTSRRASLAVLVVTAALSVLLAGCGGSADAPPAHPFGTPPSPAPGVRAWAAGEVGTLLVTSDGGANWARQKFYLPARGLDVAFTDARTGWLVTDAGGVLRTTDGGAGWSVVDVSRLQLKAVAATDEAHAWVVGAAGAASGDAGTATVRRTSNGGETWTRTSFGGIQLADVAFADPRHGVLVALDRIWVTQDGGRSWSLSRRLGMTVLTSVCTGDAYTFWVAGWGTQDGAPFVLATKNGGLTWRKLRVDVQAPSAGALQAGQVAAAGATHLWLTCPSGVLASSDAGETWELQKVAAAQPVAIAAGQPVAIAAADDQHVLATTSGQPVLATSNGGATWLAFGSDGFLKQPLVSIAAVAAPSAQ